MIGVTRGHARTRARRLGLAAGIAAVAMPWLLPPRIVHAITGIEGTFEYAIDAPWRIEPIVLAGGGLSYGAIPIQISIHDANNVGMDVRGIQTDGLVALGRVCRAVVRERRPGDAPGQPPSGPSTVVRLGDLDEIEYTRGRWRAPAEGPAENPPHALCRGWAGEDCSGFDVVRGTSEWHATFAYTPEEARPSTSVFLQVEVHLTKDPQGSCEIIPDYDHIRLVNELRVHLAPAPLPRFGNGWLYGDLHYHGQGTDNEGESAYNYRGVIRALGALGMDFAFAAEHASNSLQIADTDVATIFDLFSPFERRVGLRDMSRARFRFLHGVLNEPGGANRQAALLSGLARPPVRGPQVFLGGEVDLIPEVPPGTVYGDVLPWGNAQEWSTENLCFGSIFGFDCQELGVHLLEKTATDPDSVLVDDIQGTTVGFARHHVIWLPRRARADAFVQSNTSRYGGARRRFGEMRASFERLGHFFAAHPLSHHERSGVKPDLGPNDIPWNDHLYAQVFQSPAFLGLQFWNEDARLRERVPVWDQLISTTPAAHPEFCGVFQSSGTWYVCPTPGGDIGYERLDIPQPGGLGHGEVPARRPQAGFGNGLFHLAVRAPVTGVWAEQTFGVQEKLHHGAFTWDRLNHWGLDLRRTPALDWLSSFLAPRRLYMAGGSDAHGDLNYRRTGYFIRNERINDAALGKPRNLVQAGPPQGLRIPRGPAARTTLRVHSQDQVVDALAEGRFSVTDGPALRIAIDRNDDGVIDSGDARMGEVFPLSIADKLRLPLLVEWRSTPEFGAVARVDLYVGARSSAADLAAPITPDSAIGRTYAPFEPGVLHPSIPGLGLPDIVVEDPPHNRMNDNYWLDPTGLLRFVPADGYQGTQRVVLDLTRFHAMGNVPADRFFVRAFAVTHRPSDEEICTLQDACLERYAFTNPIWASEDSFACSKDAGLDTQAPQLACNAPPRVRRRDLPASFQATAEDVCASRVELSQAQCFSAAGEGRPLETCPVTIDGAALTVARGVRRGTVVRWLATATDVAGNAAAETCETEVGPPGAGT